MASPLSDFAERFKDPEFFKAFTAGLKDYNTLEAKKKDSSISKNYDIDAYRDKYNEYHKELERERNKEADYRDAAKSKMIQEWMRDQQNDKKPETPAPVKPPKQAPIVDGIRIIEIGDEK